MLLGYFLALFLPNGVELGKQDDVRRLHLSTSDVSTLVDVVDRKAKAKNFLLQANSQKWPCCGTLTVKSCSVVCHVSFAMQVKRFVGTYQACKRNGGDQIMRHCCYSTNNSCSGVVEEDILREYAVMWRKRIDGEGRQII